MYGHWSRNATRTHTVNRWETGLRRIACALAAALERMAEWRARAAQRRHLAMMSDHMLRDIGIDSATARRESIKPFWRA